jgi:LPS export ABC transporter protein LptC
MERLARGLLLVVVVFVGLVVATLMTKSRTTPPVESAPPNASKADQQIKEAVIEEHSGQVRWELTAEQALVFEKEQRTAMRKISALVHDRGRSWTILADEGDVVQPAPGVRQVEVRKNVVVTTSDGYRLETSVLRWGSKDERIWTDAPVRLTRDGTVIEGRGFDLATREEAATVQGRVHARFVRNDAR